MTLPIGSSRRVGLYLCAAAMLTCGFQAQAQSPAPGTKIPPRTTDASKPVVTQADGQVKALNPQPLPPIEKYKAKREAALNPQPLPPVEKNKLKKEAALNPQPLPPVEKPK
jgi:hypothetical protein